MKNATRTTALATLLAASSIACGLDTGPRDGGTDVGPFFYDTFVQETAVPPTDASHEAGVDSGPADVVHGYHTVEDDNYSLPRIGGEVSGTLYDGQCAAGSVVVGIVGRAGLWNDQVAAVCAPVRTNGTLGAHTMLAGVGGGGGGPYEDLCPTGKVLVEMKGLWGRYIDSLTVACAPLTDWTGGLGSPVPSVLHGGDGGTIAYDETCQHGYVIDGISGEASTYLNSLNPRCVRVTP